MNVRLNMKSAGWVLLGMLIVLLAVYVWPTPYAYYHQGIFVDDGVAPVDARVSRFTGYVQALTITGWQGTREVAAAAAAAAAVAAATAPAPTPDPTPSPAPMD